MEFPALFNNMPPMSWKGHGFKQETPGCVEVDSVLPQWWKSANRSLNCS